MDSQQVISSITHSQYSLSLMLEHYISFTTPCKIQGVNYWNHQVWLLWALQAPRSLHTTQNLCLYFQGLTPVCSSTALFMSSSEPWPTLCYFLCSSSVAMRACSWQTAALRYFMSINKLHRTIAEPETKKKNKHLQFCPNETSLEAQEWRK